MISLPFSCHFSISLLHVSCPTLKTSPFSITSPCLPYFPFHSTCFFFVPVCSIFCKVFIGSGQSDSLYCFNTFLRYLCFSNLRVSSPKPSNDLICPTLFSFQPPFTSTYFSIISCYYISSLILSKNSQRFFLHKNIFTFSHHSFTSQQTNLIPSLKKFFFAFTCPPSSLGRISFSIYLSSFFSDIWSLHILLLLPFFSWEIFVLLETLWSFSLPLLILLAAVFSSFANKHTAFSSNMWYINVLLNCPVFRSKSLYLGQGPVRGLVSPLVYKPLQKFALRSTSQGPHFLLK